jgi:hypothetical protein
MNSEFIQKVLLDCSSKWYITPNTLVLLLDMIHSWTVKNPNRNPNDSRNLKGDLGELYVRECIKRQLADRGLVYSHSTRPMNYQIRYQYPKARCIDIYLRLVDEDMNIHKAMIEVSNWQHLKWGISDYIFEDRILNKFKRYDRYNRCEHILCVQRRNVRYIAQRCRDNKITIIPLREHITPEYIYGIRDKNLVSEEYIKKLESDG